MSNSVSEVLGGTCSFSGCFNRFRRTGSSVGLSISKLVRHVNNCLRGQNGAIRRMVALADITFSSTFVIIAKGRKA